MREKAGRTMNTRTETRPNNDSRMHLAGWLAQVDDIFASIDAAKLAIASGQKAGHTMNTPTTLTTADLDTRTAHLTDDAIRAAMQDALVTLTWATVTWVDDMPVPAARKDA
jgi:hypothetical protein